jgi:hypothetical protein
VFIDGEELAGWLALRPKLLRGEQLREIVPALELLAARQTSGAWQTAG